MVGRLFKFVGSLAAAESLLAGGLKFTRIHELNDPSEMFPVLDPESFSESLHTVRKNGYGAGDLPYLRAQGKLLSLLAPQFQALPIPETIEIANKYLQMSLYEDIELMERLLRQTVDLMRQKVGVLCLTETYYSLPMWAHYAHNGHGFVVEYENLEAIFSAQEPDVFNRITPIAYAPRRGVVTFHPQSHENIFFSKFDAWAYEKEYRVVLPLQACKEIHLGDNSIYIHNIPKKHVKKIICGWCMPKQDVEALRVAISAHNPTVELCRLSTASVCKGQFMELAE